MKTNQRLFILHKPAGYVSQFKCDQAKKKLLGDFGPFPESLMAIGRLDEDSEGLLLLTNCGILSEYFRLDHVSKDYWVQVDGQLKVDHLELLSNGVEIAQEKGVYRSRPCQAKTIKEPEKLPHRNKAVRANRHRPSTWLEITLNEGKNRQVRKMTAAVGFPTLRLIRTRVGEYSLNELEPGNWKEVSLPTDFLEKLYLIRQKKS